MDAIIESLENALQIAVLGICGIFSLVRMHSVREKSYLLLFAFYGSFLLGDLYWQVCLLCLGDIPRISIVSDLSWCAALLFLYLLLRAAGEAEVSDGAAAAFSVNKGLPWLAPVFTAAMAVFFIQNGKIVSNIVYAVLMGILLYTAVKGLLRTETGKGGFRLLYLTVFIFCLLEYALWTVSCFWERVAFRYVYFCIDIMITLSFPFYLKIIKRKVRP